MNQNQPTRKTTEGIIKEMRDIIPYFLPTKADPYIKEAMEEYAKQEADLKVKEFKDHLLNFWEGVYHGIPEWKREDIIMIIKTEYEKLKEKS